MPGVESVQQALSQLMSTEALEDYKCSKSKNVIQASQKLNLERSSARPHFATEAIRVQLRGEYHA